MKMVALILGIVFLILTFVGAGYVMMNNGQPNAGYAVIPALWSVVFFEIHRRKSNG